MAYAIHFICRRGLDLPENVTQDPTTREFTSGYWDISDQDAGALIGGWLYLHERKADPSYFGGPIHGFVHTPRPDVAHTDRIGLRFRPSQFGKGQIWRGQDHIRAWTSGLIPADLKHETSDV